MTDPGLAVNAQTPEALMALLAEAREGMRQVVFGQDEVINLTLVTVLAGGHGLLVGLPGLAKTRLVRMLGRVLGLDAGRVQFTPDLMPADILGAEVLEESPGGTRAFRFLPGPVFCQLLMADEINRASPRTQSALLQAMQEGEVSIAGTAHGLPRPFHVLATQNPLEHEGTYPLPEAQLDRFLMQIDIGYPDLDSERRMLLETTGPEQPLPSPAMTARLVMEAQGLVRRMPVSDSVVDAILTLVREGRPGSSNLALINEAVSWGPGPRAAQSLLLAARAHALLDGRLSPSIADVGHLAAPVLKHRMALGHAALADGITLDTVMAALTATLAH